MNSITSTSRPEGESDRRRRPLRLPALLLLLVVLAAAGACADDGGTDGDGETETTSAPGDPTEIVLMTHDSFAVSDETWQAFEAETGLRVRVLRAGDAGAMLNQAILTKDEPLADVIFGVDNTFLSRALAEDLFVPYESPLLDAVPETLDLDPEHRVTPIDFGDVTLNYDRELVGPDAGLPVPSELRDLTRPEYEGALVVQDPSSSSPGLAFLLATIEVFGEEGDYTWRDFWAELRANDVLAVSGWEEAYYSHFSAASEGDRPLVVSYASSPPAEVIFAEQELSEAPTGVVTAGAFRQIEFAGILAGTERPEAARELIDFMLSRRFQEDIPLNMFVFPANESVELPLEFVEHTDLPADPVLMDPDRIDENREEWIEEWQEIVLR